MKDTISFIVSSKGRPDKLDMCVAALKLQDCNKEIIVAGTNLDAPEIGNILNICNRHGVLYLDTGKDYLYEASNKAAQLAQAYWLAFPNDDCYLVPGYGSTMLDWANRYMWSFVTCDIVYDPRHTGAYEVMAPEMEIGKIDKIQFVIQRGMWDFVGGFPIIENQYDTDDAFCELVAKSCHSWGRVRGVLGVHN